MKRSGVRTMLAVGPPSAETRGEKLDLSELPKACAVFSSPPAILPRGLRGALSFAPSAAPVGNRGVATHQSGTCPPARPCRALRARWPRTSRQPGVRASPRSLQLQRLQRRGSRPSAHAAMKTVTRRFVPAAGTVGCRPLRCHAAAAGFVSRCVSWKCSLTMPPARRRPPRGLQVRHVFRPPAPAPRQQRQSRGDPHAALLTKASKGRRERREVRRVGRCRAPCAARQPRRWR